MSSGEGRVVAVEAADAAPSVDKRLLIATGDRAETTAICDWALSKGYFPWPLAEVSRETLLFEGLRLLRVVEWRREYESCLDALAGSRNFTLFVLPAGEALPAHESARIRFVRRPCSLTDLIGHVAAATSRLWPERAESGVYQALAQHEVLELRATCDDFVLRGRPLGLRRTERLILSYLMRHADRFVPTHELQSEALGSRGTGAAARNQIYEVRRKLRNAGLPDALEHVAGKGYRLNLAERLPAARQCKDPSP